MHVLYGLRWGPASSGSTGTDLDLEDVIVYNFDVVRSIPDNLFDGFLNFYGHDDFFDFNHANTYGRDNMHDSIFI